MKLLVDVRHGALSLDAYRDLIQQMALDELVQVAELIDEMDEHEAAQRERVARLRKLESEA